MVVIGYSVPITDQLSQALLRADVNNLKGLIVVNPDPGARNRVRELLSSALSSASTLVEMSTFEELADHLPLAPTESPPIDVSNELKRIERRLAEASSNLRDLEVNGEEHETVLEDIRAEIHDLQGSIPDFKDEISRVEGRIFDLEARIESLPL